MKDFILYQQPRDIEAILDEKRYPLSMLREAIGSGSISELEIVRGGTLELKNERGGYRKFKFSCEYEVNFGSATAVVERDFELWQAKENAHVVSFGSPRKVSRVAVKLLSMAAFDDFSLINSIAPFLSKSSYSKLMKRVQELDGRVKRLEFKKASYRGVLIDGQIKVSPGEKKGLPEPEVEGVIESADEIRSMGFAIPSLADSVRPISFKMLEWGGGQIYSPPKPLPHECARLFDMLENVFLGTGK